MFETNLGEILAGFLVLDGLGLAGLAWVMFRDRRNARVFWFLGALYASFALFLVLWVSAATLVPTEMRTLEYRQVVLVAAIVLSLGIVPAVLHIVFGVWRKDESPVGMAKLSGELPVEDWMNNIAQIVRNEQLSDAALRAALRSELEAFFLNRSITGEDQ